MDKFCRRCGAKMIGPTIHGTDRLSRWFIDEFTNVGKTYRKDNGEEIKINLWQCPNSGRRTKYNWFSIFLGAPKYEEHDVKAEYINHDNPNAWII